MDELKARPPHQVTLIRENICQALLHNYRQGSTAHAAQLIKKLQRYVSLPPQPLVDAALPFNFYVERVIPIAAEGLFISGWMRDPLKSLLRLEAVADIGITLDITDRIFRFPRPDVAAQYEGSAYGNYEEDHGFIAYIPLSPKQREIIRDMATLHGFRFRAELGDGAVLDIVPEATHSDVFSARDFVLKSLPDKYSNDIILQEAIAPASLELQRLCMEQVGIREVRRFNQAQSMVAPEVSFIIPLYKRLEYLKPQMACFAADSEIVNSCELIYVLDSPEQAHEADCILRELCALYPLAVTLVIMPLPTIMG